MIKTIRHFCCSPRTVLRRVLSLDDTPHAIALGAAVGMAIGMTPTVGIQMVLVLTVAWVSRRWVYFNRPAALTAIYVSNPLTVVPLYWFLYWVGTFFVAGDASVTEIEGALKFQGVEGSVGALMTVFLDFGVPLSIGTAIVAPLSGLLTYPLVRSLLHRSRSPGVRSAAAQRSVSATSRHRRARPV